MKSCRRCKNFNNDFCKTYNIRITDVLNATYCKNYNPNKTEKKSKVKCINCKNKNKYHYCSIKKRCFNFEERIKERQCTYYVGKA